MPTAALNSPLSHPRSVDLGIFSSANRSGLPVAQTSSRTRGSYTLRPDKHSGSVVVTPRRSKAHSAIDRPAILVNFYFDFETIESSREKVHHVLMLSTAIYRTAISLTFLWQSQPGARLSFLSLPHCCPDWRLARSTQLFGSRLGWQALRQTSQRLQ